MAIAAVTQSEATSAQRNRRRPPPMCGAASSMEGASPTEAAPASAGSLRRQVENYRSGGSRWTATPPTTRATPATSIPDGTWPRTTIPITVAVAGSSETRSA